MSVPSFRYRVPVDATPVISSPPSIVIYGSGDHVPLLFKLRPDYQLEKVTIMTF